MLLNTGLPLFNKMTSERNILIIMLSVLISRMLICIHLLLNISMIFFVWQNKLYHWRVLPFGMTMCAKVFTLLTKPIGLCLMQGFSCILFFLSFFFWLHINLSKLKLHLTQCICFLGICWNTVDMFYLTYLINLFKYSSCLIPCCRDSQLPPVRSCLYGDRPVVLLMHIYSFAECIVSFKLAC